jgi:hypothetical protein
VGPTGAQGVAGPTGAQGVASTVPGPTGAQGPTGPAGSGSSALADLTDVDLTTAATNGQALVYDTATSTWKPGSVAAGSGGVGGSFVTRTYSGDGTTVDYTVTSGLTVDSVLVLENGIAQTPTVDYTVTGTTLTFTTAPASGMSIQIRELGGGDVTLTSTQTLSNKTVVDVVFEGDYTEQVFTITDGASVDLDPSNGTVQVWTLGANRSPTATNFASGQSMTLMVDDGAAYAITWPSVTWKTDGGVAPTLNTASVTVIQLWKVDTVLYGARVGDA